MNNNQPVPYRKEREQTLYKYDGKKQWFCAAVFLAAGLGCWALVETLNGNVQQVRVAIVAVLALQAYSMWQYYQWRQETMDTLRVLEDAEPEMRTILETAIDTQPALQPLAPIWDKLHAGRLHHQDILVHITSLQYALASTLILASIGGGIAAFFILPTGWNGARQLLTTLFLSMVVMVTYCQMTPKVLSLPSNLTVHLARYHAFIALRWHVYRYVVTGQGTDGKEQSAQSFLNDLTQQLIELPPAPFGIDPSQVTSISALAQQFSFRSVNPGGDGGASGQAGFGNQRPTDRRNEAGHQQGAANPTNTRIQNDESVNVARVRSEDRGNGSKNPEHGQVKPTTAEA